MSTFKYGDEEISSNDIMIAVPSMAIGVGILYLPRSLAESTQTSDGWITIMIAGAAAVFFTWLVAKLAANFPNQSFLSYTSSLISKPVAILLTCIYIIQGIFLTAYVVRAITDISHQYLFDKTPIEVITLTFLLVVVYAVSGSRAGVFRLNAMFLPVIFITSAILILFSINFMEVKNVLPVFKTDIQGYMQGTMDAVISFTGFGILFFYLSLVKDPKKAPGKAAFGMTWAVTLYIFIYLTCIAVFGLTATENIRAPFVELAKSIEVPGGFFERLESLFFVIWIMAIFTTTTMAFDATVLALQSIFPKSNKLKFIFILAPLIFIISTIPDDFLELTIYEDFISYFAFGLTGTVAILLWVMYKVKGGAKNNGK